MLWNWVTIKIFAEMSGYSEEATRQKIKKNQWLNRVELWSNLVYEESGSTLLLI